MEEVTGRPPRIDDLKTFQKALQQPHGFDIIHGEMKLYTYYIYHRLILSVFKTESAISHTEIDRNK